MVVFLKGQGNTRVGMNYRRYEKGGTVQVGAKRGMWGPSAPSTKNKPRWMEGTPSGGKPGERPHSAPQAVVASADQKSGHHAGGGVKAGSNNSAGSAASHTSGDTSSKIENRLGIVKKNRRSNYTGTLSGLSCIDLTKDDSTDTRKKINDYIKISREVPTTAGVVKKKRSASLQHINDLGLLDVELTVDAERDSKARASSSSYSASSSAPAAATSPDTEPLQASASAPPASPDLPVTLDADEAAALDGLFASLASESFSELESNAPFSLGAALFGFAPTDSEMLAV